MYQDCTYQVWPYCSGGVKCQVSSISQRCFRNIQNVRLRDEALYLLKQPFQDTAGKQTYHLLKCFSVPFCVVL